MKSRLNSLAALIAFFGASQAFAQSVQTEVTQPSSAFVASAEAGQFGIASQSITSAGLKLGYEFRASSKFSLGLTAAQDFSISGFSSLSTGFGGVVRYHLSGDWFPRTETTTLNGVKNRGR